MSFIKQLITFLLILLVTHSMWGAVTVVIDNPSKNNLVILGESHVMGWAADHNAVNSTGIDTVQVSISGLPNLLRLAQIGVRREDVARSVGNQFFFGWSLSIGYFNYLSENYNEGNTFMRLIATSPSGVSSSKRLNIFLASVSTANLVRNGYRYFLRREADSLGFDFCVRFTAVNNTSVFRDTLADSVESRLGINDEEYVGFLYLRYLGRLPDPNGLATHVDYLSRGNLRHHVRDAFINSLEARALITDREFVQQGFLQILNVIGNKTEVLRRVVELQQGKLRSALRDEWLNSLQFKRLRNLGNASADAQTSVFDFSGLPIMSRSNG